MAKKEKDLSPQQQEDDMRKMLWASANKLRSNMDAAEYKHVVLGLIFLKYISDAFLYLYQQLKERQDTDFTDPEDPDEYLAEHVFFVPEIARWSCLQARAKQGDIGKCVDSAMQAIEQANPSLKGVLPSGYAREQLDKTKLGELIDLFGNVGLGTRAAQAKDLLGSIYEYFLGMFADAEGKRGGQFYTPGHIVHLLAEMLEPYRGRVYDPCCGSGGMFVASEKFVAQHQGRIGDISIYGQESNPTTWRLAKMNLTIRGIEANIAWGDTLLNEQHRDLKADYIMANPPFNISDWYAESLKQDQRWKYGLPPAGNANYAWLQHILHHLSPTGTAGVVLANGSMTSNSSGEGDIRRAMIEDSVVDCMVALPNQLFYNTQIPVCLWFLARDRRNHKFRDRRNEILFIDARKLGTMVSRKHKELTEADIQHIAGTYHAWRNPDGRYTDTPGYCKAATLDEVRKNDYVLTPGRYVGAEETEVDEEAYEAQMQHLTQQLAAQMAEGERLNAKILENLKELGYGN